MESVPEPADAARQPATDVRTEHSQSDQQQDQADGDREADDEDRVDVGARAPAEGPVAGAQRQHGDDDDVRDALDEDGAHRARDRGRVVRAQQVCPVQVAQLGGDQAVDEPRQEQDLGRVAEANRQSAAPEDVPPPESAKRKGRVVGDEGEGQESDVGLADELRNLAPVEVVAEDDSGQEIEQHQPEQQRADGAHVEQPSTERDLVEADLLAALVGRSGHPSLALPSSPVSGSLSGSSAPVGRWTGSLRTCSGRSGPEDRPGRRRLAAP